MSVFFGFIFYIDWLIKSFIFGFWLGEHLMKRIIKYVYKQIENCNYFGEFYGNKKR